MRFALLNTSRFKRPFVSMLFLSTVSVLMYPFPGMGGAFLAVAAMTVLSNVLAYSRDANEFLVPRPLGNGQRLAGSAVFAAFAVLVAPGIAFCLVDRHWIDHGGLGRLLEAGSPNANDIRYLRDVLGATFMPDQWPADGLPLHLWARLRPLLYLDLSRMTLLSVAALFAGAPLHGGKSVRGLTFLIVLTTFAAAMRLTPSMVDIFFIAKLPIPSLGFVALLAAVSIAQWFWWARFLSPLPGADVDPPLSAVTGSSTRG
jgi:hypothetical protein